MASDKKKDSVIILTNDSILRKGIALSLMPYFSTITAPTSEKEIRKLISSKKYDAAVIDFNLCCKDDLSLYRLLKEYKTSLILFVLAFSLDERGKDLIERNDIRIIVNSIDEIVERIESKDGFL